MSDDYYRREFYVPPQFLLMEDWETVIWNETLQSAHAAGKVPIGPIMISQEQGPQVWPSEINDDGTLDLIEGPDMKPRSLDQALVDGTLGKVQTVKIIAEVLVGASLDG